ncbi:MAG: M14 family metallopeptidase [Sneathiella sp.]
MTVSDFFSATYQEARSKFLKACEERSLTVQSHLNDRAKGALGEDLFMDVARIGPLDAKNILIISSATHGGEGFCGSGLQVGMLRENYFSALPSDTAVLLIHAINPYGFSHIRRVNEDNIDLNRNFRDFSKKLPDNPAYREVHDWIIPSDWNGPAHAAADTAIEDYISERGMPTYQAAVTGGQHIKKDGVFYGGTEASWTNLTLREVVKEHASETLNLATLDIHTGLGPYGYGEIIYLGNEAGVPRAMEWYDGEITSPAAGTSSSAIVEGTIDGGVCDMAPKATHTCVAIEYGTLPLRNILQAVRADNWLYINGDVKSDLGQSIKKDMRDAFYCDADDWKKMIWDRGTTVTLKALKGLSRS